MTSFRSYAFNDAQLTTVSSTSQTQLTDGAETHAQPYIVFSVTTTRKPVNSNVLTLTHMPIIFIPTVTVSETAQIKMSQMEPIRQQMML